MENIVFSQSVMGFNRVQVLEYIDKLVIELKEQEDSYILQQKKMQDDVNNLCSKCTESEENLILTVEKIKELSAEIGFFKENNQELKEQVTHYRNLILSKDDELFTLKKDFSQIQIDSEKVKEENEIWKTKQDKIGEFLVDAALKAEVIIENAYIEAEEKKSEFKENVYELTGDVNDLKDEIAKVEQQLEDSFKKLQVVIENMDNSAKTIADQVTSYKEKIDNIHKPNIEVAKENTCSNNEHISKMKKAYSSSTNQGTAYYAHKAVHDKHFAAPQKKNLTESILDKISKLLDI